MNLSFTIAHGPRQFSLSRVRVPLASWPHFTVSDSRLPQPKGPGVRIYILQEQGDPVIPPGTGFAFRGLLLLVGLWWRYLNPSPHGVSPLTPEWHSVFALYIPQGRRDISVYRVWCRTFPLVRNMVMQYITTTEDWCVNNWQRTATHVSSWIHTRFFTAWPT
jgi:hypothetical protein